jgi:hypothetical protein
MKQLIKKIGAVLMAFVVLFSTMSFTISEHYCGEMLVDTALFSKAESCGMEMQTTTPIDGCSIQKDSCCSDVLIQIEGQSELKANLSHLSHEQAVFIALYIDSYINLFEGLDTLIVPFKYYSPPLLVWDIQVLDEVFLI